MTHEMKLEVPFDLIKNGKKVIEVRLYDESRFLCSLVFVFI